MSLQDALQLTTFAKNIKCQGVMTWDANIDSLGIDGNAPYAFTTGYGAAHLLKVPDELLIRNSANIGAAGADMASEILFYGSQGAHR